MSSHLIMYHGWKATASDKNEGVLSVPPCTTNIIDYACVKSSLTSLSLSDTNIYSIGRFAFYSCFKLQSVVFPSRLREICNSAFDNCPSLKNISFPSDSCLIKIGSAAFRQCIKLENFKFPPNIRIIGDYAFRYCQNIVPDFTDTMIRYIGIKAFTNRKEHKQSNVFWRQLFTRNNQSQTSITLPPTISIDSVLKNQDYLIQVDESHPTIKRDGCGYYNSNGVIFQGKKKSKHVRIRRDIERIADLCFNESYLVTIIIPSSVIEIGEKAFQFCYKLKKIQFEENSRLQEIKSFAFNGCSLVKKINFPKTLKILRKNSFKNCTSLETVSFPPDSQLERIEAAFPKTSIQSIALPSSIKEIDNFSFKMEKLKSVRVFNKLYRTNKERNAILSRDRKVLVCVLSSIKDIDIHDKVRVIKEKAFYGSKAFLTIPASVEVIESKAFHLYKGCAKFNEKSKLKTLACDARPYYGFHDLNNRDFIRMENGVLMTHNPFGIVDLDRDRNEIEIEYFVEVIHSYAFVHTKLTYIKFPKSLKRICSYACSVTSLQIVEFEEGTILDSIDSYAFHSARVTRIKLPLIKDRLDDHAFDDVETIEFPPNFCPKFDSYPVIRKSKNLKKIICPKSSLKTVCRMGFKYIYDFDFHIGTIKPAPTKKPRYINPNPWHH